VVVARSRSDWVHPVRSTSAGSTVTKGAQRQRIEARRRPPGTPTVVFVDESKWNAFHQLAPRLQRAGVRTVRVSFEGLRKTRVTSFVLFDAYAMLPDRTDSQGLKAVLSAENVVDVQFSESLATLVGESTELLKPHVADQVGRRLAVVDKRVASRLFARAGLRTPEMVPVPEASAQQVGERFGFPVVVKEAIGAGGVRVRIAHDPDELEEAAQGWGGGPGALFYEQFVVGTKVNYAAAVSSTGIEQELTYRISQWLEPVGRATEIEMIDDPQLIAFGRRVLEVSGCTGLVNMDVIRDAQGLDWLIDFNPRAFGGSGSFLAAGVDFSEGYLRAIGQRAAPPLRANTPAGASIRVFPTCLADVIATGTIPRTAAAFARESFPYLRWYGLRYWLSEALSTADSLHRSRQAAEQTCAPVDEVLK